MKGDHQLKTVTEAFIEYTPVAYGEASKNTPLPFEAGFTPESSKAGFVMNFNMRNDFGEEA